MFCALEDCSVFASHIKFHKRKHIKSGEKLLLESGKLDKPFFNELILSVLDNENGETFNDCLKNGNDIKRLLITLHSFLVNHQGASWLDGCTMERIADALKLYGEKKHDELALDFYQAAMRVSPEESEDYARFRKKLYKLQDEHKQQEDRKHFDCNKY